MCVIIYYIRSGQTERDPLTRETKVVEELIHTKQHGGMTEKKRLQTNLAKLEEDREKFMDTRKVVEASRKSNEIAMAKLKTDRAEVQDSPARVRITHEITQVDDLGGGESGCCVVLSIANSASR